MQKYCFFRKLLNSINKYIIIYIPYYFCVIGNASCAESAFLGTECIQQSLPIYSTPTSSQFLDKSPVERAKSPSISTIPLQDLSPARALQPPSDDDDGKSSNPTSHRDDYPITPSSLDTKPAFDELTKDLDPIVLNFTESQEVDPPISFPIQVPVRERSLLQKPPILLHPHLKLLIQTTPLSVIWDSSNIILDQPAWRVRFDHLKGLTSLSIEFMNEFPFCIKTCERSRFTDISKLERKAWIYYYQFNSEHEDISQKIPLSAHDIDSQDLAPLIVNRKKRLPIPMTISELSHQIEGRRVLFYSGLAISPVVLKATDQLMREFGLSKGIRSQNEGFAFIKNILSLPCTYIRPVQRFFHVCVSEQPSAAHIALSKIVLKKNWGLLTQNIDFLHQRAGVDPLSPRGPNWLKDNVMETDLKDLDIVITIGLDFDTSGFLGWYKKINPKGKIIGINDEVPSYLDHESYYLKGDPQTLVPLLYESLL